MVFRPERLEELMKVSLPMKEVVGKGVLRTLTATFEGPKVEYAGKWSLDVEYDIYTNIEGPPEVLLKGKLTGPSVLRITVESLDFEATAEAGWETLVWKLEEKTRLRTKIFGDYSYKRKYEGYYVLLPQWLFGLYRANVSTYFDLVKTPWLVLFVAYRR